MQNNVLFGFTVFDDETGKVVDRVFAVTSTGQLLIEQNGRYMPIPKMGRLRICYGDGDLERW